MRVIPRRLIKQVGWVAVSHVAGQATRLVTNVILARLLAPQLFGIMLIVNTLRTGVELLSDIGIAQNVVSDPKGAESSFYNTAWTLQIIRGFILFVIALILTIPIAQFYENDQLKIIFPAVSIIFVLNGIASPSRFVLQKMQDVATLAKWDFARMVASLLIHVAFAWWSPTVWALVYALIVSTVISSLMTFFYIRPFPLRLMIDKIYAWKILSFGKWIFASSVIYFLAMNFDRLYFGKAIPFVILGIYGVAKTFSEAANALVQRVGNLLIFPKIASAVERGLPLKQSIVTVRRYALLCVAVGLSLCIAVSDLAIVILYDDRYIAAAFILPILMLGVWFSILATIADNIMLGIRKPAQTMTANFIKLVWTVVGLPLAMGSGLGFLGALFVIAVADLTRYVSLEVSLYSKNLLFLRQDFLLTALLLGLVVCWRFVFVQLGFVVSFDGWRAYGAGLM